MSLATLLQRFGLRRTVTLRSPTPIMTSPISGAIPTGPAPGPKLTEDFVREIGRFAISGPGRW
jgi:hypothetical protein